MHVEVGCQKTLTFQLFLRLSCKTCSVWVPFLQFPEDHQNFRLQLGGATATVGPGIYSKMISWKEARKKEYTCVVYKHKYRVTCFCKMVTN